MRSRGEVTGADGRFEIQTILPGRYLNGRKYRPDAPAREAAGRGARALTTQLYFAGDPYNERDPFVVPSLIMPHEVVGDTRRARFQFVPTPQ